MDSEKSCLDRQHFENYAHPVEYSFNSRGFRDQEWPVGIDQLSDCVWCLGDSFTVGIGSPLEHTWPYLLSKKIQQRTINVSMDGASNDWIARKSRCILQEIKPKHMIIMWSYLSRREIQNTGLSDEQRRLQFDIGSLETKDTENFKSCVTSVLACQGTTNIIMYLVPKFAEFDGDRMWDEIKGPSWPQRAPRCLQDVDQLPVSVKKELMQDFKCWDALIDYLDLLKIIKHKISVVPQLDIARDGHHFDGLTSAWIVDDVMYRMLR